jgi:hypothetical protein
LDAIADMNAAADEDPRAQTAMGSELTQQSAANEELEMPAGIARANALELGLADRKTLSD